MGGACFPPLSGIQAIFKNRILEGKKNHEMGGAYFSGFFRKPNLKSHKKAGVYRTRPQNGFFSWNLSIF